MFSDGNCTAEAALSRFMNKVQFDTNGGCWLWAGAMNGNRYGGVWDGRRLLMAHRVSWEMHRSTIPQGMVVCHRCDVTVCVNPDHLFVGTQKDNVADCFAKGRGNRRPPRGERHGRCKIGWQEVREIRRLGRETNMLHKEIAERFDVGRGNVGMILRGQTWVEPSHG